MDESYTRYQIATHSIIQQKHYFDLATLEEIKETIKEIQHSLGEMTQLSIHQEFKNEFVSSTKEKTKESQLENFQIKNLEDKIEEQEFENGLK